MVKESYLARIHGAVGTQMFRDLFFRVDGKKVNITQDGDLSCALFASTVLIGFSLIESVHATVVGTVEDMKTSGWIRVSRPRIGCVVVWERNRENQVRRHIGFYSGYGKAISNDSQERSPQVHSYKSPGKVTALYWHDRLG